MTANRTYYVRTDGNDSNSGLVNDASGAFLTIQKAINVVSASLDRATFGTVIQVGAGTYAENLRLWTQLGTGLPVLRGDNTTPGNVIIAPASGDAVLLDDPAEWRLEGFKIVSPNNAMNVSAPTLFAFRNIDFGACGGLHLVANLGGVIVANGSYTISGGATFHMVASSGSAIYMENRAVTLTGTPNFSGAYALAERAGSIVAVNTTFTGSATGVRYIVKSNGVIDTAGAGATYLPGNSLFAPATGGQYV